MPALRQTLLVISLLAAASSVSAQGYWFDYCCGDPLAPVYESWPKEAYYAPIGPMPWYGSMTVAEQSRMLAARAEAQAKAERQRDAAEDR
jgi:hypothetical protein